ncbi:MAG TPA: type I polyketide synthase [Gemmataceae bacterium]|jgi:acyl transferase domain-containing protein
MLFVNARKDQPQIAVVGIGCWYPGARGPQQLWENILTRRREFRRLPDNRLPLADYHDPDRTTPDKTYGRRAAVLDGYEFDWSRWRIPQATAETTDIVQWLALEVANLALENAGLKREMGPREKTGVIVGNTLTGEHTRSQSMRLRWPFVRRALLAAAASRGLSGSAVEELAKTMEGVYKSVFAPVTEDTLAGGLSNTIAGRICNFFDFHGGGYTVDGACSSSLLAVCTAANMLNDRDLDMALAGGVDISLDTFELIGFAKTGALSPDEMRVYDKRGNGFIPGEGCGFVVMKRLEDARAAGDTVYAVLRGWGVSSDGKGGLTAPKREGQTTSLRRAYERAGYSPATLDFVEGHGTGTRVGDKVELEAIAAAIGEAGVTAPRSVGVTSFKSIVGHTKAAAGVGAFIKGVIAANRRVLPPIAGCSQLNPVFDTTAKTLYPILHGRVVDRKVRVGVSAMGFGGINAHITLESGDPPSPALAPSVEERALLAANQETEVFVFAAELIEELCDRLAGLADTAERLSMGELTDLAAHLSAELSPSMPIRAAVIASNPDELAAHLRALDERLRETPPAEGEVVTGPQRAWWVGNAVRMDRLGFLCPGQGSQQLAMARILVERYPWAREMAAKADAWLAEVGSEPVTPLIFRPMDRAADADELKEWNRILARTEIAQPAICLASLLHARYLARLGLRPQVVGGHSLGELTAFHLAGAFDEETLIKLAALRGRAMAASPDGDSVAGAMVSLACPRAEAETLIRGLQGYAVVANINSPRQTVISGEEAAVQEVLNRAGARGIVARRLPVSNAFHSRLVASAADKLRDAAPVPETADALNCRLVSSMTGRAVEADLDLREHFATQVTARVDFIGMVGAMQKECDQLIEVGPGRVLSGLVADINDEKGPVSLPVAGQPDADRDLNNVLARAFVQGVNVNWPALYEARLVRDFVPPHERLFIDNPCERPFPELPFEPLPSEGAGALESFLVENTGCEPDELREYLARRQGFLANVVQADILSLNGSMMKLPAEHSAQPFTPKPRLRTVAALPVEPEPKPVAAPPADAPVPEAPTAEVEDLLLDLAAKRTGFAKDTITMEARLLDDLNLDSIKAAELVAAAAKQVGAAGKVDPSKLANASLAEVAFAIREVADQGGSGPAKIIPAPDEPAHSPAGMPSFEDDSPSWVRNFTIEYIEAA